MRRRSGSGESNGKPRRRGSATLKRRSASKVTRNRGTSVAGRETVVARVTRERFDRVGKFALVMSASGEGLKEGQHDASTRRERPAWRTEDLRGVAGKRERALLGASLELALLCRDRRQSASFCSLFVQNGPSRPEIPQ